jgi:membrane protein
MVLRIDGVAGGRIAVPIDHGPPRAAGVPPPPARPGAGTGRRGLRLASRAIGWMVRGYQQANAGDLAAAVAFNALVAFIPTFLLCLAVAGLFLRLDRVLITALYASFWGLPAGTAGSAFEAVLSARENSSWLGALSVAVFAWTGAGFVSCLARSMNRVYGVSGCGYMCERRRGFFVIIAFAALFLVALLASTVPTLFVAQDVPYYFERWALAAGEYQVLGYVVAFVATVALFGMLYRVVPNAGQKLPDVWPGTLTAATLFVGMAQVFPIYLRLLGGANRYGAVFGLVSLLVAWFYLLAHVLLFGTYVNATYQRRRRQLAAARECTGPRCR